MAMVAMMMAEVVLGQNRRPTISFITQPEIVADIGGDVSCNHYHHHHLDEHQDHQHHHHDDNDDQVEMKCTIQYASDYPVIWMKLDSVDR